MSGAQELTPLDQDTSPEAWKEKPILIDNLSETTWQEEWLFHFLNARHSCVAGLLIADRRAPSAWSFAKADVVSRCRALPSVSLEEPDESLVEALLKELFHRRGVTLSQEVARFLSFRVERRYTAVLHLVERLNGQSLQQRRPITVPFLRAFREFSA
jgi:chromosomal replication initiation ATPase DnaA